MKFIIAHISPPGSKNNQSYYNYYFEKCINTNENMKWNDNKDNTLSIGDYLLFYCWGKRVEIHKIINRTDYTTSRSHWKDINNCNVLHLSECLKTYSFEQFKLYKPPYAVYKKGYKRKNVYQLERYPKLMNELNKPITIENLNKTNPSQLIQNYYNLLLENDDIWGKGGSFYEMFARCDYYENSKSIFKEVLHFSNPNTLKDYNEIVYYYQIGTGPEETEFNNSRELQDAIILLHQNPEKCEKKFGKPDNWYCKDWINYNTGNMFIFCNSICEAFDYDDPRYYPKFETDISVF